MIEFDSKRTDIPSFTPGVQSILLQKTVTLRGMYDGLIAVPLQGFEASEQHARRQHQPQIRLGFSGRFGLDQTVDGFVALLQSESRAGVLRFGWVDRAGQEFLMQRSYCCKRMADTWFVMAGLKYCRRQTLSVIAESSLCFSSFKRDPIV